LSSLHRSGVHSPYQERYEHRRWKEFSAHADRFGHGGTDYLELQGFVEAVRDRVQTPIDVYDPAAMSVIIPLSAESIAKGSAPVEGPDFTAGKWKTNPPRFGLEA
jgi:hypothetical protein